MLAVGAPGGRGEDRVIIVQAKLAQLRTDRDESATQAALAELTRAAEATGSAGEDGLGNNLLALAINAAAMAPCR